MADIDDVGRVAEGPSADTAEGSVVRETGMALVHQGEQIVAPQNARATIERGADGLVVNYYFPIEIVIAGSLPESEREAIEARVWTSLSDAIQRVVA
jgi:hypothetical protein